AALNLWGKANRIQVCSNAALMTKIVFALHPAARAGRLLVGNGDTIQARVLAGGTWLHLASTSYSAFCAWSADGTRVLFWRFNATACVAANGSGVTGSVRGDGVNDSFSSPGPDPDSAFANRATPEKQSDIYLMSISGAFEPKPLISTPAYE